MKNELPERKKPSVRQPVLLGLFAGTAVGTGYLLSGVPNVELMTLIIALSGVVLGPALGPLCGVLAGTIYSLGNPYGPPPPVLLVAQMLGHGLNGFLGWFLGTRIRALSGNRTNLRAHILAVAAGFMGTLFYQILTNLAIVVMTPDVSAMAIVAGMAYFALVHIGVNSIIFFLFFPSLVRRLGFLGQSALVARNSTPVVLGFLILTTSFFSLQVHAQEFPAQTDSMSAAHEDSVLNPALPLAPETKPGINGWKRPLWNPFSASTVAWLNTRTQWVPITDGGLGGMTVILGEGNTSISPLFLHDGIPQGTGHKLADDPWLVSNQGLVLIQQKMGRDWAGGTDGVLNLKTDEKDQSKAVSYYKGIKGPHETYSRGISLLTPKAAWRLGFEFDENIDDEGYNYTELPDENFYNGNEFRGHSSIRRSRTRLIRHLDDQNSLELQYTASRKTKDDLPTIGAQHQEIWVNGAALTARTRAGSWAMRSVLHWDSRTVEWGDRPLGGISASNLRKLETGREGIIVDFIHAPVDSVLLMSEFQTDSGLREESLNGPDSGLRLMVNHWDVHDDGPSWSYDSDTAISGDGLEARLVARTGLDLGVTRLNFGLSGDYQDRAGINPGGFVAWQANQYQPWWKMAIELGGRAPRSDELLTPLRHVVTSESLYLLPNADLEHEKTLRAGLLFQKHILGLDFAFDASARQLRQGITWMAIGPESRTGTWGNDLEMDSTRLTVSMARQGRFLGWGRARLEGTWQNFDEKKNQAAFLPPEKYLRMELMWEEHFFQEDGILQLAMFGTHRGAMTDPWDVTRTVTLPSGNTLDLLVGFRLVGAHLSLNFRNVTNQRIRLSSATLSPGMEMDMRLHWVFLY